MINPRIVGIWQSTRNKFFKGKSPFYHAGKNADKRVEHEDVQKENYEKSISTMQTVMT